MFSGFKRTITATLIAALVLCGCSKNAVEESEPTFTESEETTEATTESTTEPQETEPVPFEFNLHAYSGIVEAFYGDEYRESFFNLCDALNEGKESFECANEEVYKWCLDPVTLNQLYPVAVLQIEQDSDNPYENGIGHFQYKKSLEDFLERQKGFQEDVEEIINANVRSDYSDFEKCLALYDYIASNYTYDHDGEVSAAYDGATYTCYRLKKGICCDFGAWYAYLLMECGVNAIEVQNFGDDTSLGYHAWTFVEINGKGYHIDATWGLESEYYVDGFPMEYFMMTDADRASSGYPPELLQVPLSPYFYANEGSEYSFTATDSTYHLGGFVYFVRFDPGENNIYYRESPASGTVFEFKYE